MSNCYCAGNVVATQAVGGLAGYVGSNSTVLNSYSVGMVSANAYVGGMIGSSYEGTTVSGCYYDSENSGQSDTGKGEPKTTAQMKQQATYVGWDFNNVWDIDPAINDGYPFLRGQAVEPEVPIIDDDIPAYVPQSSIKLQFTTGDSTPYDMGVFYVDRTQFKVGDGITRINARNAAGKYLKDQSFDENHNYAEQPADALLENILSGAGLMQYYIAETDTRLGFDFPSQKPLLDGIEEVIQYLPEWDLREDVSGRIVIAPRTDPKHVQPETYTFRRDVDIFSREQIVDDRQVYGRVCVQTEDETVRVYRPVTSGLGWSPPARKTLYQTVPDGTTSYEAAQIATRLAESLSNSGRVETFVCAFRPHLMPGDGAEILDSDGAKSLGVITQIVHSFGTSGFYSEITIDSGGRIGKARFSDIVNALQPLPVTEKK